MVSFRGHAAKPEKFVMCRGSRLKAGCTVESLALPVHPVCDAAASSRIKETAGELYLGEAFIPFHGPKAHADSQDWLPHKRAKAERRAFQPAVGSATAR